MHAKTIKLGLFAAAAMNIGGVLIFSRAFTNTAINDADPVVMSNFGLLMIAVWGLAYLGTAFIHSNIKWLAGAFAIEKLVYVVAWINWVSGNSLSTVYDADLFAGAFYTIYGLNDFVFMIFFSWVFTSQRNAHQ
ncbi:hypothetical protein [Enterovibrio norvegicus]|uniref:hypothetical protein n=1 Tax=Enterovibrio norvegicus TaxID=188144 RepID=UPI000C83071E|nr:hypothetical protein [Enterovibrio norvegicus]PMN61993.1 hypothetical protein BCT27_11625 [Enterovibrio norvegicus]